MSNDENNPSNIQRKNEKITFLEKKKEKKKENERTIDTKNQDGGRNLYADKNDLYGYRLISLQAEILI